MDAVRYCIDTLKESVPIWKKEIYREGEPGWKQNAEFMNSDLMRGAGGETHRGVSQEVAKSRAASLCNLTSFAALCSLVLLIGGRRPAQ